MTFLMFPLKASKSVSAALIDFVLGHYQGTVGAEL